jgi:hypothetical protein
MFRPFFNFVAVCVLLVSFAAADADRAKVCNSDTDCVVLRTKQGAQLQLDYLDFDADTAAGLLEKLPSWFGPRPVDFVLKGQRLLNSHETLREQGVQLGDIVMMFKQGNWDDL